MKKLSLKEGLQNKKIWGILAIVCCIVLCFTFLGNREENQQPNLSDTTPQQSEQRQTNPQNNGWQPSAESIESQGYYAAYRLERERVRANQIELLNGVVDNGNSSAEEKKEAQDKILEITDNMGKELQIEQLLQAKGFQEAAVFIQDEKICIVLDDNLLSTDGAAQVVDIVKGITGKGMENVVIVPKN